MPTLILETDATWKILEPSPHREASEAKPRAAHLPQGEGNRTKSGGCAPATHGKPILEISFYVT
jgi:hypothetical protein